MLQLASCMVESPSGELLSEIVRCIASLMRVLNALLVNPIGSEEWISKAVSSPWAVLDEIVEFTADLYESSGMARFLVGHISFNKFRKQSSEKVSTTRWCGWFGEVTSQGRL